MPVIAHAGQLVGPHDLLTAWSSDPAVLVTLAAAGWGYGRGIRGLWRCAGRGGAVARWQAGAFWTAMAVAALALVSPLDALSGELFSAHMVQHLLLTLVAAPLFVLSAPSLVMVRALGARTRRQAGRWHGRLRRVVAAAWPPVGGLVAYTLVFTGWHLPVLYDASLSNDAVHALEHTTMLGAAITFWSPIVRPRSAAAGLGVVLLFLSLVASGVLAALLVFAPTPWYAHPATETWGLSALADQQLAGAVMWILGGAVHVVAGAVVMVRWLRTDAELTRRRERGVALAASGTDGHRQE